MARVECRPPRANWPMRSPVLDGGMREASHSAPGCFGDGFWVGKRSARALLIPPSRVLGPPTAGLAERLRRSSDRRLGVALVFHAVGESRDDPRRDLVQSVSASLFESQVRYLKSRYRLVAASELIEATATRRRGERFPVALTFDDDLPCHVAIAGPILRHHGVPATFFLCGAGLAGPHRFWWERLQELFDAGRLTTAVLAQVGLRDLVGSSSRKPLTRLDRVAGAVEAMAPDDRRTLARRLESLLGPDPSDSGLRAPQVRELAAQGFEVGFHTRRHDPLPQLTQPSLDKALREGRADLGEHLGYEPTVLSYPHCRANERVARAAREAGYAYAFTGGAKPVTPATNPMLMPRLLPASRSTGHLATQVAAALHRGSKPSDGA